MRLTCSRKVGGFLQGRLLEVVGEELQKRRSPSKSLDTKRKIV